MAADSDDERSFFGDQPLKPVAKAKPATAAKHYHGHRDRLRERFEDGGAAALADYELLELLLFRSIPRADTKPIAKALLGAVRHVRRSARRAGRAAAGGQGRRRRRWRSTSRSIARGRPAHGAERDQGPRDPVVMGQGDRLLPGGDGVRGARAVPHPVPRQEERADRRRGAADRDGRPHAGLSARGRAPRARTVGDRDRAGPQPSVGRPDTVARRHRDDQADHRHGQAARHFGPRPHHHRQDVRLPA